MYTNRFFKNIYELNKSTSPGPKRSPGVHGRQQRSVPGHRFWPNQRIDSATNTVRTLKATLVLGILIIIAYTYEPLRITNL